MMTRRSETLMSEGFQAALASRYWHEADARAVLDAWTASGVSLAAFAEYYGLQLARLDRWARRFNCGARLESLAPSAMAFFEVVDPTTAPRTNEVAGSDLAWHIELDQHLRIRVPCAGGAGLLAETLRAVREVLSC